MLLNESSSMMEMKMFPSLNLDLEQEKRLL